MFQIFLNREMSSSLIAMVSMIEDRAVGSTNVLCFVLVPLAHRGINGGFE
jgi:hypothetical protein